MANCSYQKSESEIEILTGMHIGHSSLHRYVQNTEYFLPDSETPVTEVSVDGGKVRLRTPLGQSSEWLEYKAVRLQKNYYNAAFQNPLMLTDWVNSQPMGNNLYCLGDGHAGVWKLIGELAQSETRCEILDWYHLRENLYKVGGSLKRLKKAESYLWSGQVDSAKALFELLLSKRSQNFCEYLKRHSPRIINYQKWQQTQKSSIGSGAVESAIKQIDLRLKLPGAQWNKNQVNQILQLRCAYLNGQLAVSAVSI